MGKMCQKFDLQSGRLDAVIEGRVQVDALHRLLLEAQRAGPHVQTRVAKPFGDNAAMGRRRTARAAGRGGAHRDSSTITTTVLLIRRLIGG